MHLCRSLSSTPFTNGSRMPIVISGISFLLFFSILVCSETDSVLKVWTFAILGMTLLEGRRKTCTFTGQHKTTCWDVYTVRPPPRFCVWTVQDRVVTWSDCDACVVVKYKYMLRLLLHVATFLHGTALPSNYAAFATGVQWDLPIMISTRK